MKDENLEDAFNYFHNHPSFSWNASGLVNTSILIIHWKKATIELEHKIYIFELIMEFENIKQTMPNYFQIYCYEKENISDISDISDAIIKYFIDKDPDFIFKINYIKYIKFQKITE